jgi:branched-chain amino acid transport system substrate-binding protein
MMKRILVFSLIMVTLIALVLNAACTAAAPQKTNTLKLGAMVPLSGPAAAWGDVWTKIADLYVDLLNRDGGVAIGNTRYTIKLFTEDDKLTPDGAATAVHILFDVDEIDALVGEFLAPNIAIGGDMAAKRNKVYVSGLVYIPGSEVLGPKWPTTFACYMDCVYVFENEIPELKKSGMDIKNFATLVKDDVISHWVSSRITELAPQWEKENGIKQVYSKSFPFETTDFTPWLTEIAALPEKVDTVYVDANPGHLMMIAKQNHEINPGCRIIAPMMITDINEFVDATGYDAAQNVYALMGGPWDYKDIPPEYLDMANRIREEYKTKYGNELTWGGGFASYANCIAVYLEGAKKAGSTDTEAVVRALETAKNLKHFYGPTSEPGGEKTFGNKHFWSWKAALIGKIEGREQKVTLILNTPPIP